ncbi:dnaJ homolog subfamily C member 21 [Orussus abietinus]|uniref:dnaJ homolog subfamily C member 21 n=1 Tax=Orussus abietinus TaxID=222816 RepID=UPI00062578DF|nr:dnaJ homolog subfamily C member 21 [Orussus abietinus]
MKCYYEVLGIPRDVSGEDLKKAYRKLALKWHPDKNLDCPEEAKDQFQLVQQAWEVLSDPHERAWYDNHREAILKGGIGKDYKDDSIDLFQYFSTSCFKGYGDDEKGFYTVYRTVFEKLAAEDADFHKEGDSDEEVPGFGNSTSSYEDVVHNFYAYWQSYSTKRSFAWLDLYDIREAQNRRVVRLMEKENKKVREKAKRERNEQVRNLVAFVRKRDKRVQAHAQKLADRAKENAKKAQERQKQQLLERQQQMKNYTESEWSKFSNIEKELKNIESNLAAEFGEELSSSGNSENEDSIQDNNALYCVACNKIFKTQKAFTNHENSKKHKDNVSTMTASLIKDDNEFTGDISDSDSDLENKLKCSNSSNVRSENVKLATGPEMPDFIINPIQTTSKIECNDTSEGERISGSESNSDDLNYNGNSKENFTTKKGYVVPESQMDNVGFVISKPSDAQNDSKTSEGELISDQEGEEIVRPKKQKKKKGRSIQKVVVDDDSDEHADLDNLLGLSKKQRVKENESEIIDESKEEEIDNRVIDKGTVEQSNSAVLGDNSKTPSQVKTKGKRAKEMKKAQKQSVAESKGKSNAKSTGVMVDVEHCCVTCKAEFQSKNQLFEHLKTTGHSVYIPDAMKKKKSSQKTKGWKKAEKSSD